MDTYQLIKIVEFFFDKYGYLAIFLGSLVEMSPLGWVVPGGTILAVGGFFANGKDVGVLIMTLFFGTLGSWLAFMFTYLLGVKSGMWLVTKLRQTKNAAFAKRLLENHGPTILTTSMMANMTRFWIAYIAGVEKYSVIKFSAYSLVASFGWTSLLVLAGFIAGYEKGNIENLLKSVGVIGWVILLIALITIFRSIKHEYKHYAKDVPHNEDNRK